MSTKQLCENQYYMCKALIIQLHELKVLSFNFASPVPLCVVHNRQQHDWKEPKIAHFWIKNLNKRQVHEDKNNWKDRSLDHDGLNSPVIYRVEEI